MIIPTYNVEKYLQETLGGLVAQTHGDWNAVLVDDGSTDSTVALAQEFARTEPRLTVLTQSNQGGAVARERGFDHLGDSVDAVLFFDHDDTLRPDALASLVDLLQRNPGAPAVYGLAAYMDSDGVPHRPGRYERYLRSRRRVVAITEHPDHPDQFKLEAVPIEQPTTYEALVVNNYVPIGGILIRRTARLEVGRFDPETNFAHDWDYWIRLSLLGPLPMLNRAVYDYRVHPTSMSRSGDRLESGQVDVWRKFIESHDVPAHRRLHALAAYRLIHRELAARKRRKAVRRYLRFQFAEGRTVSERARIALSRFSDDAWRT